MGSCWTEIWSTIFARLMCANDQCMQSNRTAAMCRFARPIRIPIRSKLKGKTVYILSDDSDAAMQPSATRCTLLFGLLKGLIKLKTRDSFHEVYVLATDTELKSMFEHCQSPSLQFHPGIRRSGAKLATIHVTSSISLSLRLSSPASPVTLIIKG